jgi:hypothetical protein
MHGAIPPFPNTPLWCGAQLKKKHRNNFTFTLYNVTLFHEKVKDSNLGKLDHGTSSHCFINDSSSFEGKIGNEKLRISEPKREEVAGGWRRQYSEELHNLHASSNIITVIKS